jgi:hypothetical protein
VEDGERKPRRGHTRLFGDVQNRHIIGKVCEEPWSANTDRVTLLAARLESGLVDNWWRPGYSGEHGGMRQVGATQAGMRGTLHVQSTAFSIPTPATERERSTGNVGLTRASLNELLMDGADAGSFAYARVLRFLGY